jgi:hypothetical protein
VRSVTVRGDDETLPTKMREREREEDGAGESQK